MAMKMGQDKVAELLQQTLDEEGAADKKLTAIAEDEVLAAANTEETQEVGSNGKAE